MDGWTKSAPRSDTEENKSEEVAIKVYVSRGIQTLSPSISLAIAQGRRPPTPPLAKRRSRSVRGGLAGLIVSTEKDGSKPEATLWPEFDKNADIAPKRRGVVDLDSPSSKKAKEFHDEKVKEDGHPTGLNFFAYHRIWREVDYFEAGLPKVYEETLTKFESNLKRLSVSEERFARILLTVSHFVTVAAVGYKTEFFDKPGLHPTHPDSYDEPEYLRQVALGEVLVALSSKPVQLHSDLLHGLIVQDNRAIIREFHEVPSSEFQVSVTLVTLALSFLAHIGCITVGYGSYTENEEFATFLGTPRGTNNFGVTLAQLHYLALTVEATNGHELLNGTETFVFSVPDNYDYAWYALLRQVIYRTPGYDYYSKGFVYEYTSTDKTYQWDHLTELYWCPVLRKDFAVER